MLWPRGEAVAAKAVGEAGTICTLSTLTGTDLEEVRAASKGPCWYQLYLVGGKTGCRTEASREQKTQAILLLFSPLIRLSPGNRAQHEWMGAPQAINGTPSPETEVWPTDDPASCLGCKSFYADGGMMQFPERYTRTTDSRCHTRMSGLSCALRSSLGSICPGFGKSGARISQFIMKGVQCVEDAQLAVEHGVDAIVISNHGGRQMDRVYPTLYMLKDIAVQTQRL